MQITIMQPTYLPWLGYFALMMQTDQFIFLNDVQFDRRSWQQRNKIKSAQGELLLTVPVVKKSKSGELIKDVLINQEEAWKKKHLKSMQQHYSKSKYYGEVSEWILPIYERDFQKLADLNISIIKAIADYLRIDTNFVNSSDLGVEGNKAQRLVNICKKAGADTYLSPMGSFQYIDEDNVFAGSNVNLLYQNFEHPEYSQLHGEFLSHLSVIDLLMNEGKQSASVIQSGIQQPYSHEGLAKKILGNDSN